MPNLTSGIQKSSDDPDTKGDIPRQDLPSFPPVDEQLQRMRDSHPGLAPDSPASRGLLRQDARAYDERVSLRSIEFQLDTQAWAIVR